MGQMNIKEIALKVAEERGFAEEHRDGMLQGAFIGAIEKKWFVEFAEALIAELAKGNEPCAFLHEWIEYHPFGDTFVGEPCATITSDEKPFDSSDTVSPLFTFPPTAEQIANETAEAIARMLENGSFLTPESRVALAANGAAKAIRNGAWKEFKK